MSGADNWQAIKLSCCCIMYNSIRYKIYIFRLNPTHRSGSVLDGVSNSEMWTFTHNETHNTRPRLTVRKTTFKNMIWWNGLFLLLDTNLIGFRWYQVDELSAAVENELPCIIGDPDSGNELLDHFVECCPGHTQFIILASFGQPSLVHGQSTSHTGRRNDHLLTQWIYYNKPGMT